jgi:predicted amino acid dehydrogenase
MTNVCLKKQKKARKKAIKITPLWFFWAMVVNFNDYYKKLHNLGFSSTYRTRGQTHTIIIKRKLSDSHKEHFGFRV